MPEPRDLETIRKRIGWITSRTEQSETIDQWECEALAALTRLAAVVEATWEALACWGLCRECGEKLKVALRDIGAEPKAPDA